MKTFIISFLFFFILISTYSQDNLRNQILSNIKKNKIDNCVKIIEDNSGSIIADGVLSSIELYLIYLMADSTTNIEYIIGLNSTHYDSLMIFLYTKARANYKYLYNKIAKQVLNKEDQGFQKLLLEYIVSPINNKLFFLSDFRRRKNEILHYYYNTDIYPNPSYEDIMMGFGFRKQTISGSISLGSFFGAKYSFGEFVGNDLNNSNRKYFYQSPKSSIGISNFFTLRGILAMEYGINLNVFNQKFYTLKEFQRYSTSQGYSQGLDEVLTNEQYSLKLGMNFGYGITLINNDRILIATLLEINYLSFYKNIDPFLGLKTVFTYKLRSTSKKYLYSFSGSSRFSSNITGSICVDLLNEFGNSIKANIAYGFNWDQISKKRRK